MSDPSLLIDGALPSFDFSEDHEITIEATAGAVFAALPRVELARSAIVRALFLLRGIPAARMRLGDLPALGFLPLGEEADRELLFGLVGQPWRITGGILALDPTEFAAFDEPGYAKIAWNFTVEALEGGRSRLATETRIRCTDAASRRRFGRYWRVVGPFSAWIRRIMLRTVRDALHRDLSPAGR